MRTRLDEIVEEALGEPRFKMDDCVSAREWTLLNQPRVEAEKILRKATERAFRHGVEQMAARVVEGSRPGYLYYGPVKPAPAEEK